MSPTPKDLVSLYGPGVRYMQAKDLRIGMSMVMTRSGKQQSDCSPIALIQHRNGGPVHIKCMNLLSFEYHPRALVLVYSA